jgi:NTP pyrophosphatase (non-canonical NTP hydrolase)
VAPSRGFIVKCPKCQAEMLERVSEWECPNNDPLHSLVHRSCNQVPLCKGCLEPMAETGAPIWELYCNNADCPRKPEENMRDLFKPELHRFRILDFTNGETQQTVNAWVHDCFPEWSGPRARALAIIEEAVELALATGLSTEEIKSAVDLPIIKETMRRLDPDYVPEGPDGEVADTLLNVLAYAEEIKVDAHKALNEKMKINRSRPKEHYLKKTAEKKALGLKL